MVVCVRHLTVGAVESLREVSLGSPEKNRHRKIPSLCAVSVRTAILGLVVDEKAGGVVERTALGWILTSKKNGFPPGVVKN